MARDGSSSPLGWGAFKIGPNGRTKNIDTTVDATGENVGGLEETAVVIEAVLFAFIRQASDFRSRTTTRLYSPLMAVYDCL